MANETKKTTKIKVSDIAKLAQKIRKPNEKWQDTIKRAAAQLKKENA